MSLHSGIRGRITFHHSASLRKSDSNRFVVIRCTLPVIYSPNNRAFNSVQVPDELHPHSWGRYPATIPRRSRAVAMLSRVLGRRTRQAGRATAASHLVRSTLIFVDDMVDLVLVCFVVGERGLGRCHTHA